MGYFAAERSATPLDEPRAPGSGWAVFTNWQEWAKAKFQNGLVNQGHLDPNDQDDLQSLCRSNNGGVKIDGAKVKVVEALREVLPELYSLAKKEGTFESNLCKAWNKEYKGWLAKIPDELAYFKCFQSHYRDGFVGLLKFARDTYVHVGDELHPKYKGYAEKAKQRKTAVAYLSAAGEVSTARAMHSGGALKVVFLQELLKAFPLITFHVREVQQLGRIIRKAGGAMDSEELRLQMNREHPVFDPHDLDQALEGRASVEWIINDARYARYYNFLAGLKSLIKELQARLREKLMANQEEARDVETTASTARPEHTPQAFSTGAEGQNGAADGVELFEHVLKILGCEFSCFCGTMLKMDSAEYEDWHAALPAELRDLSNLLNDDGLLDFLIWGPHHIETRLLRERQERWENADRWAIVRYLATLSQSSPEEALRNPRILSAAFEKEMRLRFPGVYDKLQDVIVTMKAWKEAGESAALLLGLADTPEGRSAGQSRLHQAWQLQDAAALQRIASDSALCDLHLQWRDLSGGTAMKKHQKHVGTGPKFRHFLCSFYLCGPRSHDSSQLSRYSGCATE